MDDLELIDVVDLYTLNRTGNVKTRTQVYLEGVWHITFHVWMYHPKRRSLYVQQRSSEKLFCKDLLDVTVGGTVRAGEEIEDSAREIEEELGFAVPFDDLLFLEKKYYPLREGNYFNNQVAYVFLYAAHLELEEIRFNPEEVAALYEIPFHEVSRIFADPSYCYLASGILFTQNGYQAKDVEIQKQSFVPSIDNYPFRIVQQAELLKHKVEK